jgi:polysaccharide deacetylase 2 family uncharacterized protein YibQ
MVDRRGNKQDHASSFFCSGRYVIFPRKMVPALAVGVTCLAAGLALSMAALHFLRPAPMAVPVPPPIVAPAPPLPAPEPEPEAAPAPPEAKPAEPEAAIAVPAPAWQAYAVPAKPGKAMIAVIIDDMGVDRRRSAQVTELPGPLTLSYMTYAPHAAEQVSAAHARGHELMMHMPMQPVGGMDPGPGALTDQLPPDELRRRLTADLDRFQGYVGVNNHMGSKFTANAPGMRLVMEALHQRGLLFIDSMTTAKSVGMTEARAAGVPTARRNIFLDDVEDQASVAAQLAQAEEQAKKTGSVIVIGHPHDGTIAALSAWLPGLAKKGITLVPVTAVVKAREAN